MPRLRQSGKSDTIKAFRQLGFRESGSAGNQAIGNCPLCGRTGHFYINRDTKQWDCKKCGKSGGFQTFLQEAIKTAQEFSGLSGKLQRLSDDRGVSPGTFTNRGVGFNIYTNEYLIPIYYQDGAETRIWDIRRFEIGRKGGTRGMADCTVGILNWEQAPAFNRLWLCEGEWDAMAADEMLERLGMADDLALGLPGAGTLKADWIPLFQDHDVITLYDNDEAGRKGALKAYNMLKGRVRSIKFVHWGEGRPDGYDFRDLYREKNGAAFDTVMSMLRDFPEGTDVSAISPKRGKIFDGPGLPPGEVYQRFNKWLYQQDNNTIDVVFGSAIANRLSGDPLWVHVVAPPGGTKTEILRALSTAPEIVYRTTISARGLVSGQISAGGADPSLLPRLDGRILVIEDFTGVMAIPAAYREEIFGILRSAYNGEYEREYGNGRYVRYKCKFGILSGVTPAIEHNAEMMSALGERFLMYWPSIPRDIKGRRPYLQRARENTGRETEMRTELAKTAGEALNHDFSEAPEIPGRIGDQLADLAQWVSYMRGVVRREKYGASKEITHEPYAELGTRLVKQFQKLLDGIGRFKRLPRVTEAEMRVIRKIAVDSTPSERRRFSRAVWKYRERAVTTAEISEELNLPRYPLCERTAETLCMLGVLVRDRSKTGNIRTNLKYRLSDSFYELTESSRIYNH